MTFFNRKEEVINIELTQYGKYLLSIGKFKPAYYEFFDDDILYDAKYSGEQDEKQRDIQSRIKDTLRTHAQYTFVSPEEELKRNRRLITDSRRGEFSDAYLPFVMKHRVASLPLGNSQYGEQKKPAWSIRLLNGKFSDTNTFITGTYSNLAIPRLTLENCKYKIKIAEDQTNNLYVPGDSGDTVADSNFTPTSNLNNLSTRFADQTYLEVQEDYILIDLEELNTHFENDNFEIEIFEIQKDENDNEVLNQLFFNKMADSVVDNILVDTQTSLSDFKANRADLIHTYFNIQADREIDSRILCNKLSDQQKQLLIATNQLDLNCDEVYESLPQPRIVSDVMIEDLGDKC